jgi:hypothetical protein
MTDLDTEARKVHRDSDILKLKEMLANSGVQVPGGTGGARRPSEAVRRGSSKPETTAKNLRKESRKTSTESNKNSSAGPSPKSSDASTPRSSLNPSPKTSNAAVLISQKYPTTTSATKASVLGVKQQTGLAMIGEEDGEEDGGDGMRTTSNEKLLTVSFNPLSKK